MLPICASFSERGPGKLWASGWAWWISIKGWPLPDEGNVNSRSPKTALALLDSRVLWACPLLRHYEVPFQHDEDKKPLGFEGETPNANTAVWGAFVMLLEKQRCRISKGFQTHIRGSRMTGPEIKHFFTPWTGTRAAAAPSTLTPEVSVGICHPLWCGITSWRSRSLKGVKFAEEARKQLSPHR